MTDESSAPGAGEPEIRTRHLSLSLVWLIPIVAALVGVSMLVREWQETGPVIRITFDTAEGLTPGQTRVKHRSVVIGDVTEVDLSDDQSHVIATVELNQDAETFTREDSRFWVVRPRIGTEGISGLETLLGGDFIAADPGASEARAESFQGLESPPAVIHGEEGTRFHLTTASLGSLDVGSPIYYRQVRVGKVVDYQLNDGGDRVRVDVFVTAPADRFVTEATRFWNVSGIELGVSASGVELKTESLLSILTGGIAFEAPASSEATSPAGDGSEFRLFSGRDLALAPDRGPPQQIRMRFAQSLRGLRPGASVEFMGRQIGEVSAVTLDYDDQDKSFPVIVEADVHPSMIGAAHDKLLGAMGASADNKRITAAMFEEFVNRGLRAEARTGNLLTGQLYVALEFYPEAEAVAFNPDKRPVVIPTRPTSLDKVQEQLVDLVDRLSRMPVESIGENLDGSLAEMRQAFSQLNRDVLPTTLQTLEGIDGVMTDMQTTLNTATNALGRNSPERRQIGQVLNELDRMSRSVRELSDYLRRHPEALIRGRQHQGREDMQR